MERANHNTRLHTVTVWRNLLLVGMGMSLSVNLVLGLVALDKRQSVILVPSPAGQTYQLGETVNAAYLEDMGRDVALTFLNVHPGTTDYVRDAVLKIAHPAFYGEFKRHFDSWMTDIKARKLSTAFYPTTIAADTPKLTVRVTGVLKSFIGEAQVDSEQVAYVIGFNNAAGRLSLSRFEEEQRQ
ncbi:MAG: TraE/TraK family type IV conjugative transfer system protein [Sphingomonadales bacterium]